MKLVLGVFAAFLLATGVSKCSANLYRAGQDSVVVPPSLQEVDLTNYTLVDSQDISSMGRRRAALTYRAKRATVSDSMGLRRVALAIGRQQAQKWDDVRLIILPPASGADTTLASARYQKDAELRFVFGNASAATAGADLSLVPPRGLKYRVYEREDVSAPGRKRVSIRVVVEDTTPTPGALRDVADRVGKAALPGWADVHVFIYLPGMDPRLGAYATAFYHRDAASEFKIFGR